MTWCDVQVDGMTALIHGQHHALRLMIETLSNAQFTLERLEQASRENAKSEILKRLSVALPVQSEIQFRVQMEILTTTN